MNANELRKLADGAPERKRQAEITKWEQELKHWLDGEWAKARKAAEELKDRVHKSATEGKFKAIVYTAQAKFLEGPYSPVVETIKTGWLSKKEEVVIRYIPDYAQYVFDSCPYELNPRWVGVDWWEHSAQGCSRGAREIQLHVSW